jgi:hypothetical protein
MCLMQVETKVWVVKDIAFRTSLRITKVRKQIKLNEKYVKKTHHSTQDCTRWHRWGKWMDDFFPTCLLIFQNINMIIDTNRCVCLFVASHLGDLTMCLLQTFRGILERQWSIPSFIFKVSSSLVSRIGSKVFGLKVQLFVWIIIETRSIN